MKEFISEYLTLLAIFGIAVTLFFRWIFSQSGKIITGYYKDLRQSKDLHPYFHKQFIKEHIRHFIPTKFSETPPSDYESYQEALGRLQPADGIKWMLSTGLREDTPIQYYLILADAGMGKTSFMINLFLKYKRNLKNRFDIKLFPISNSATFNEVDKLVQNGEAKKTILLLDAFDEDRAAAEDWKGRFQFIIEKTRLFRKVVITSRTQFFPDYISEPTTDYESGKIPLNLNVSLHRYYIMPFNPDEVNDFLNQKFRFLSIFRNKRKIKKAKNILNKAKDLEVRPMILSYIQDLIDTEIKFKYTFQVYEELIFKWISRETERIEEVNRRDVFRENMHKFSNIIAQEIFKKWEHGRKGYYINKTEIDQLADTLSINLSKIEMTSRSLLNRNADGEHKFSHKSIFEFFLAKEYMINDGFKAKLTNLDNRVFDQTRKFIAELSEDRLVHKFIHDQGIRYESKYYSFKYNLTEKQKTGFMHGHLKTLWVNEKQLIKLLNVIDDRTFLQGLNNLYIRGLVIFSDSIHYNIEKIKKIYTLRRITIYNGTERLHQGKLIQIEAILPHCYIEGFDIFKNRNDRIKNLLK